MTDFLWGPPQIGPQKWSVLRDLGPPPILYWQACFLKSKYPSNGWSNWKPKGTCCEKEMALENHSQFS